MPGFDFDLLIQEIRNGKVVPIVGTELYVDASGVPLDETVASRLAAELELTSVPAGARPRDVALAYLVNRGDMPTLLARFRHVIEGSITEPPRALQLLAQITDFRLYVTTAIDRMMEKALDDARGGGTLSVTYSPSRPAIELPDMQKSLVPAVCHLLGRVDDEFPLGDADVIEYLQALLGETRRPQRLFDELRSRNLLFIGCGFPDWLSRMFIRTVKDREFQPSWAERRAQFIADAQVASDQKLTLFLSHYNLKLHPPGPTTEFVEHLHALWSRSARPLPARLTSEKATMKAGSVFLSFSSEDRETVKQIAARLQEAGIPVWFDETGIEMGADWDRMIQDNLLRATLFVPFVSGRTEELAEQPHYFWREWNLADERAAYYPPGTKFILPIALDPVDPETARVPRSFRIPQWVKLHGRVATPELVDFLRTEYRRKQVRPG